MDVDGGGIRQEGSVGENDGDGGAMDMSFNSHGSHH